MIDNKLIIPKTNQTPLVEFDTVKGTFHMQGKIIPENPMEFFNQISTSIEEYIKANPDNLEINMQLDYFNTVSSKMLSKFFQKIVSSSKPTLNWYYEKDDIELKEAGEDYATIINYPINIIELEES
jgi:hypothetical protein